MPSTKPRVSFVISKDELDKVTDFQFENRLKNQTQAILKLIELGLTSVSEGEALPAQLPIFTDEEVAIIEKYRKLDAEDVIRFDERINTLLDAPKYKKKKNQAG